MTAVLDDELARFQEMKSDLLKTDAGKFALIRGKEFAGVFESLDTAYNEGVKRFGSGPFLVKQITEKEEEYRNQALIWG
jgi:hypothetical protein